MKKLVPKPKIRKEWLALLECDSYESISDFSSLWNGQSDFVYSDVDSWGHFTAGL